MVANLNGAHPTIIIPRTRQRNPKWIQEYRKNMNYPSVGSIEQYMHTVNSFPILSESEELELANKLCTYDDTEAAHKLITSHLRLVVSISRNFFGYGLPQADIIQEGTIGLMKAVKRYDPSKAIRLGAFAITYIKSHIYEYIVRNWRMVKIATTHAQRKLFFNLRSLREDLSSLTIEKVKEIAKHLDVSEEDVIEMDVRFAGYDVTIDLGDDEFSPVKYLADNSELQPQALLEIKQTEQLQAEQLQKALDNLNPRSRLIIERRWLSETPATFQELAEELGVSLQRVAQVEKDAFGKIKVAVSQNM